MGKTLFEKIWDAHVVKELPDGSSILYIDRHLVHEVTSPQAFDGLRMAGRTIRRPELTFSTMDHNVPTTEDRLRRRVIESIMCHGELRFETFESLFAIDFHEHFAPELISLEQMEKDGLLVMKGDSFTVTPPGRLLLRNIAMVFDEYLRKAEETPRFSRVI